MDFKNLIERIQQTNDNLQRNAVKAVNKHLTIRNWLIGFYIVEFEQNGSDKAQYGAKLLENIAQNIKIRGLTHPELSRCRQFYNTYSEILGLLTQESLSLIPADLIQDNEKLTILGLATQELENEEINHIRNIIESISYTHFTELIKIDDKTQRRFYEIVILKTQPSVKELKRQIDSLTFERVGLSENHEASFSQVINKIQPQNAIDLVKSHYFFEFLNIHNNHLIEERDLENALLTHLQRFISELGNGFCFEARQKRILIGDEYFYVDLVFYHRILKCHVLVELKTEAAKHENIGQLKTYLQHFKKNIQEESDNPPVGILLVTNQNKTLVEYAIADSDLDIFVSKYKLQLPNKLELESFINNELRKV